MDVATIDSNVDAKEACPVLLGPYARLLQWCSGPASLRFACPSLLRSSFCSADRQDTCTIWGADRLSLLRQLCLGHSHLGLASCMARHCRGFQYRPTAQ